MGGLNTFTEQPLIPLNLPKDVRLDFLPAGKTLEGMFEAGELDALLSIYIPSLFLKGSPRIARLFPNFKQVEQDYYRRTRIFPIMHVVVLREDVYREHPWAARSIYQAFAAAKKLAVEGLYDTDALQLALPWLLDHVEEARRVFGEDFWSYGLEPNRPTLAASGRFVHEQGLCAADGLARRAVRARRGVTGAGASCGAERLAQEPRCLEAVAPRQIDRDAESRSADRPRSRALRHGGPQLEHRRLERAARCRPR